MDLRDALLLAATGLWTHKVRSLLATVGVVLGIASVIAIVTMGAGLEQSIVDQFTREFDADLLSVSLEPADEGVGGPPSFANVLVFTSHDVARIGLLPGVDAVGADTELTAMEVRHGNASLPGLQTFTHFGVHFFEVVEGRAPEGIDEAMVNNRTANQLRKFTNRTDIVGLELQLGLPGEDDRVRVRTVTVVGVQEDSSLQPRATLTLTETYARRVSYNNTTVHAWQSLLVRAESSDAVPAVTDRVAGYLESRSDARHLKGEDLVFRYDTQQRVIDAIGQAVGQFTAFIGAIGTVALVVGLVGIANIMLVSVQERTREIGVMKATGAAPRDILAVFLAESVAICSVGAVAGIAIGTLLSVVLARVAGAIFGGDLDIPFVVLPLWYAIAVGLGVVVGIVAGIYPAWRAARVDPVEALRYE